MMSRLVCGLLLLWLAAPAFAQGRHESSLTLEVDAARLQGEWRIPLRDLDAALELDSNADGTIVWPEIEHRRADIERYIDEHVQLHAGSQALRLHFDQLVFGELHGEPFILSKLSTIADDAIEALHVDYTLLFEQHPEHRGLLKIVWRDRGAHQAVVTAPGAALSFERATATVKSFAELLRSGIWHIWIGYDHVLFLLVLLIPAVLRRTPTGREAAPDFAGPFARVIVIVSAFTLAHSITLTCAALHWIALPSRLVESAIAASVVVAALVNLLPRTAGASGVWVAFGFGLLHGFGFANVLSEIDAQGTPLWRTLIGFNLGVEVGQLAIVALFLPLAYVLRDTRFYRTGVVYGGSSAAAVCAMIWFWQRAL